MTQLEKLQEKNNKLALMVISMGACIKAACDSADPFEAAESMHKLVGVFEATVDAFEDFGNEAANVLERHSKALNGGADAGDEFH